MLAACSSTLCACRTISSPSGVTVTSLALRSNSLTSSSSSSFLIATDSVGCDTKHASAARPKCFSRATATMYFSSVSVIDLLCAARRPAEGGLGNRSGLQVFRFSTQPAAHVPFRELRRSVQHERCDRARPFQQRGVGREIGKPQQRCTRLAGAQELAGAADLEV